MTLFFKFDSLESGTTETGPRRRSPQIANKTAPPSSTTAEPVSPVPAGDESIMDILSELDTPDAANKTSASPKDSPSKKSNSKRSLDYGTTNDGKNTTKGTICDLISLSN